MAKTEENGNRARTAAAKGRQKPEVKRGDPLFDYERDEGEPVVTPINEETEK